jgi:hypothetical protein
MADRLRQRNWLIGIGTAALLLIGGIIAGPVASLAQGDPDATLTEEDAIELAVPAVPGVTADDVRDVDLEQEDGRPLYEVTFSTGAEVEVDGDTGEVVEVELEDDDDGDDDEDDDDDDDEDDD